ncbi:gamma-glutamyltransferase [Paraburkholderia sp. DHOC27]|uniref:gamma-glutamyltransferase n=1 Tax=Paraburkholderia sp. DHOC27 TaxID=2303330 RepID=UPI000E3C1AF5|nr:gamma-glutamyltransferase [Paraburkholderia sp. DHOC27]RFU46603.1 gamma-glutamyltransferase [Paraburkholderia sp. DHOC27]
MSWSRPIALKLAASTAALVAGLAASLVTDTPALAKTAPKPVLDASAVAVPDQYSAETAQQIFKEGGNAVDAAVAIAFTLAVTYPDAGNLGGGGFMTVFMDGKPYFLDYLGTAPQQATREMYLDDKGKVMGSMSTVGSRAAAVPGTVEGMWEAQQRFGKLKWKQVLAPAIHYATDGFKVDSRLQQVRDDSARNFTGKTNFDAYFSSLKAGTVFRQPELAQTLERIASDGGREFYEGHTAELIGTQMFGHGLITKQDLQQYKAVWRQPLMADWHGYQVVTAPPPSSGGVGLIQMLKMKADLKPAFDGVELNSAPYIHLIAQIEDRVFADRQQYVDDPDVKPVPVDKLTDDSYLSQRAAEVKADEVPGAQPVKPGLDVAQAEKPETTHFSVVDKWGNAVSNTYSLNGSFGSGVVVDGAGFLLNDEMDDFVTQPGTASVPGAAANDLNTIAAGRRPVSSMTPTILLKDGKVSTVIGTPGGSRIFTTIFQVMTDMVDFGMSPANAVDAMRFHHQLLPQKTIYFEPYHPITGDLADQLKAKGYSVEGQSFNGDVQLIRVDGTTPQAAADPRGVGVGAVFQ